MTILKTWARNFFFFIVLGNALFVQAELPTYTTCAQLPKVDTSMILPTLVENSPILYHYGLTPFYNCSQDVFIFPPKGSTGSDATILLVQHTIGVIPLDLVIDKSGGNVSNIITVCPTGQKQIWNIAVANFSSEGGGFLCLYSCGQDNVSLAEFKCGATDLSYIPYEEPYMDMMKNIPYENKSDVIRNLYINCQTPQYCAQYGY